MRKLRWRHSPRHAVGPCRCRHWSHFSRSLFLTLGSPHRRKLPQKARCPQRNTGCHCEWRLHHAPPTARPAGHCPEPFPHSARPGVSNATCHWLPQGNRGSHRHYLQTGCPPSKPAQNGWVIVCKISTYACRIWPPGHAQRHPRCYQTKSCRQPRWVEGRNQTSCGLNAARLAGVLPRDVPIAATTWPAGLRSCNQCGRRHGEKRASLHGRSR